MAKAKPDPEPVFLLFRMILPLQPGTKYEPMRACESLTSATWVAAGLVGTDDSEVIGILCPNGRIARVGPGCQRLGTAVGGTTITGVVDRQGRIAIECVPS